MKGRSLSPDQVEALRETLTAAFAANESVRSIAKRLNVTHQAVFYWVEKLKIRDQLYGCMSRRRPDPGGKADQDALLVALAGQRGPSTIVDLVVAHMDAHGLHERDLDSLVRRWRVAVQHLMSAGLVVCVRQASKHSLYDLTADMEGA